MDKKVFFALLPCAICMLFFGWMIYYTSKDRVKLNKVDKQIQKLAIEGNKIAIKLYRNPWVVREGNVEIIKKALEGNDSALEMLRLKDDIEFNYKKEIK